MSGLWLWAWLVAASATTGGWRGDGSGVYAQSTPPGSWGPQQHVQWTLPMPAPGNATPVLVSGLVCVEAEPAQILCADATTGRLMWKDSLQVTEVVPPAEAASIAAKIADATATRAELATTQARYGALRRDARAGGGAAAELQQLAQRMATLQTRSDAGSAYLPPPVGDPVGWTSPTPVTDGRRIWTFFGNGVVACHERDGRRVWARWLGAQTRELIGYRGKPAASPRLAGGVLVIGYNDLLGLDPATGATRWSAGAFADFGAPAVADVDGLAVVLTASGSLVRARDGVVMQTGLASLAYSGPQVDGHRVWWVGTSLGSTDGWPTHAVAWDLSRSGDTVHAVRVVSTKLPSAQRVYASVLVWRGRVVVVSIDATVTELDRASGAVLRSSSVSSLGQIWASPMVAGGRMLLMNQGGEVIALDDGLRVTGRFALEPGLAQPTFDGPRVWVRGERNLYGVWP